MYSNFLFCLVTVSFYFSSIVRLRFIKFCINKRMPSSRLVTMSLFLNHSFEIWRQMRHICRKPLVRSLQVSRLPFSVDRVLRDDRFSRVSIAPLIDGRTDRQKCFFLVLWSAGQCRIKVGAIDVAALRPFKKQAHGHGREHEKNLLHFGCDFSSWYNFGKIVKTVATRCHILKLKCVKFDFGLRPRSGEAELTALSQTT